MQGICEMSRNVTKILWGGCCCDSAVTWTHVNALQQQQQLLAGFHVIALQQGKKPCAPSPEGIFVTSKSTAGCLSQHVHDCVTKIHCGSGSQRSAAFANEAARACNDEQTKITDAQRKPVSCARLRVNPFQRRTYAQTMLVPVPFSGND
jgi:hypothetical protein